MFIEKNESDAILETSNNAKSIKDQINQCLDQAEKRPGMRKKIL
jgi:hypothetical protein